LVQYLIEIRIEKVMSDPLFFTKLPSLVNRLLSKLYEADYEEPTIIEALFSSFQEEELSLTKFLFRLLSVVSRL